MELIWLQLQILGQVILSMVLSGAIGYEREAKDKPAGLRTHVLVGGVSALFVGLGDLVTRRYAQYLTNDLVHADPIRIIQAIVTGIAFLGAGTIMRRNDQGEVHGLTTAASILFVAGIGITVGSAQYLLGVSLALVGVFVLLGLQVFERKFHL